MLLFNRESFFLVVLEHFEENFQDFFNFFNIFQWIRINRTSKHQKQSIFGFTMSNSNLEVS